MIRELGGVLIIKKEKPSAPKFEINLSNLAEQFYQKKIDGSFDISSDCVGGDKKLKKMSLKARVTSDYIKFDQTIETPDQLPEKINSFVANYSFGKEVEKLGLSRNGTGKILGKNFGTKHVFVSDIPPKREQICKHFEPIAKANRESEYVEIMREFEPDLLDIKQIGGEVFFVIKDQPPVSSSYMGSGFTRFFDILLTVDNLGDSSAVLCIDEISNGLHHSKQEHFWKIMFAFLKRYKNLQIFATTHSYEAIAALSKVFEKNKKSFGKDEIRLFSMLKDERGIVVGEYEADLIAAKTEDKIEVRS
jgi:hypothetical protein